MIKSKFQSASVKSSIHTEWSTKSLDERDSCFWIILSVSNQQVHVGGWHIWTPVAPNNHAYTEYTI